MIVLDTNVVTLPTLLDLDLHRFCSGQVLMLGGLLFEGDG